MTAKAKRERTVRRAQLVDLACRLFGENGYERTTVADILAAADISKGGFYHHFESKDDIFAACVERIATELATNYIAALEDTAKSPRQRIETYIHMGYDAPRPPGHSAIVHDLHAHPDRELHDRVLHDARQRVLPAFTRTITHGVRTGDFTIDGDAEVTAVAVLGMLATIHEHFADTPDATERVPPELTVILVERLLGADTADGSRP